MAVVGSIALSLTTAPAHAAPGGVEPRTTADRAASGIRPHAMKSAAAGAGAVITAVEQTTYTVQAGDTVSAIASRFGVRTADLLALNNLGWKSIIYPGQVLNIVGSATAPAAPAAAPASAANYTVQHGDTVSAIAKRHGVSAQAMLAANGLGWSSIIYPGQTLAVPGAAAPAAAPAPAPAPAPAAGASYTIVAGDTISAIAKRHGVSTDAVLGANDLDRSSIIYPGQTIAIPIAAVAAAAPAAPAASAVHGLDAEQAANAQLIVRVGREMGVPDRGIAIALGTAMQESWIRNLDWGDRDSLGLFQQRPSTGWGTEAEVRDPVRSIKVFYGGPSDPNGSRTRGLLDIPGWQSMSFADAAQAVQISAYPERYAQWEAPAHAWLAALG
jgi:LysM repeat protein